MITISFSKNFYSLAAVRQAARDYEKSGAASVKVKDGPKDIRAEITGAEPELQSVIRDEFANYALSQSICRL
jgi:hypothetical protein